MNKLKEEKNDRKLYNNDHEIPKRSFTHTHTERQVNHLYDEYTIKGKICEERRVTC